MAESCAANPILARKIQTAILQALSSAGQEPVASALGVSEATVSRLKSEHLENFSGLLAVLGLKVVPLTHRCYDRVHIEHLQYFARLGMAQETPALQWDDE